MKIKNIIIFCVVLVALFGLMWLARPSVAPVPSGGAEAGTFLTAAESLHNFGTISMADGNVTKVFSVTNSTDKDIKIESVATSCMCTTAYLESADGEKGPFGMPGHGGPSSAVNEVIQAGKSREVRVVYDPNAHGPAGIGPVDRFIYLTDASGGTLELEIRAVVTP